MRLFTGIALPDEITGHLSRLIDQLRPAAQVRWSPAYNLHVTTKFIGEWPEARIDEMKQALSHVSGPAAFDIQVRGFGWFPNPHNPRVLWVGVHADDGLRELAKLTDRVVAQMGIAPEKKPFSPHLTLARMSDSAPLPNLKRAIAELKCDEFGSFPVHSWHLYLSRPGPSGSLYTQLAEYPLT